MVKTAESGNAGFLRDAGKMFSLGMFEFDAVLKVGATGIRSENSYRETQIPELADNIPLFRNRRFPDERT